jgi:hypothetical protein
MELVRWRESWGLPTVLGIVQLGHVVEVHPVDGGSREGGGIEPRRSPSLGSTCLWAVHEVGEGSEEQIWAAIMTRRSAS